MERKILETAKVINTYSHMGQCQRISENKIIEKIRKLDIREGLIIIRMLLSDRNRQYYYQLIYSYRNKDKIRNKDYFDNLLFSRQGLLYTAKWILAYGDYSRIEKFSIMNTTMEVLDIQLMIVDYLDADKINPLTYIYKNLYFNTQRNMKNDISRAVYLYSELSKESEL